MPTMPELPTLGTVTDDLKNHNVEIESKKREAVKEALLERRDEEMQGVGNQCEYMNAVNWLGYYLKKGYKIEKLFLYPEDGEDKLIWVAGEVTKVLSRTDKKMVAAIKWDTNMIGEGEDYESDEDLFKKKGT
mmetsp:Transcript_19181/g.32917  ORF Transcript_19181/g.32917 Transcript_19181/m.32917 type:complete len:132 (-) Transcript_19181:53-448(-)